MMADTSDGPQPAEPRKRSRARAGFLAGLVFGLVAALFGPPLLRPYLPGFLAGSGDGLTGVVESTRLESGRMLVTLTTPDGSILVTFAKDAAGVGLLVGAGDSVTLDVGRYAPFLKDPKIARVKRMGERLGDGGETGVGQPIGEAAEAEPSSSAGEVTPTESSGEVRADSAPVGEDSNP